MTTLFALAAHRYGPVYIGYSSDPRRRIGQIQTSNHEVLDLMHAIDTEAAVVRARAIWERLNRLRLRPTAREHGDGGGWFDLTFADAIRALDRAGEDDTVPGSRRYPSRYWASEPTVYALTVVVDGEEITKVGYSDQPHVRIAEHRDWCARKIEAEFTASVRQAVENVVLGVLAGNDLLIRGEWARITHEDARALIIWVAERIDLDPRLWRGFNARLMGLPPSLATLLPNSL
ncbi:GIY-YIG nuclease family protein [Azospirillum sp. INR13]|uniref:GIY-YIG nuclease family protein n=1 Tax=Azospirillum sp. INR13 TaxID=2596919 RepID=UPI00189203B0|nr:GIY-YIG nuclease family protein [Azospirillum sp. INR13]MBF5096588.1 GIY-YIG nuclease family protein [Azospirillum sp. INR13]